MAVDLGRERRARQRRRGGRADGRDDAEAEAEAEAEAANPEPAEPAEPAEPVSASASISKHAFGRWAVASVESYNPVTGRHACLVEGGAGPDPPPPGTPPAKIRVALLERRYRVISRREDASGAQLGVGRPARGKKRARDGRVDDASAKPAKKGAARSATETEAAETFRVVVFPPPHGWDVDHFLQRRADEMWDIIEEQAVKVLGPATGAENAGGGGGEGAPGGGGEGGESGSGFGAGCRRDGVGPLAARARRLDLDAADESDEDDRSDSGDDVDSDDDEDAGALGRRGDLGWTSYADFEEEMIEALENDAPVTIVRNASRAVCDAVTAAVDARGEAEDDPPDERLHAATRPRESARPRDVRAIDPRWARASPSAPPRSPPTTHPRLRERARVRLSRRRRTGKRRGFPRRWFDTVVRAPWTTELDDGRFLDDVKRDDVRDRREEEEKSDANDAPGGDSAMRDERTPGLALERATVASSSTSRLGRHAPRRRRRWRRMLARVGGGGGGGGIGIGGGPEGLLDALMRRVVGDGAARIIVRRAARTTGCSR